MVKLLALILIVLVCARLAYAIGRFCTRRIYWPWEGEDG